MSHPSLRVAIVTETYPPEVNGVALTVQALAQGLLALGHEVEIIRPLRPGEAVTAKIRQCLLPGLPLPRYPGLRIGLPAGRTLRARWRQRRPDAIYVATEGPLGWSAVGAARRLNIPAATGFHTRYDDYMERYGARFLRRPAFAWLRYFHNRADATLVPTGELQDYLAGRGFNKVELLRRAVDTAQFHPRQRSLALRAQWGAHDNSPVLIHVGRIAPEKNLALAIGAFRQIQRSRPNARLVLVGDGPDRSALAAANPDIVFCGTRHGDDLARHFASADLFVFPSLSETFGNVTLEAMASGIATVAFDYGAAREHLREREHGAAVAFGDERAFVAACASLSMDTARCRRLGHQAHEAVSHLHPATVALRFSQILQDLAHRRPAQLKLGSTQTHTGESP